MNLEIIISGGTTIKPPLTLSTTEHKAYASDGSCINVWSQYGTVCHLLLNLHTEFKSLISSIPKYEIDEHSNQCSMDLWKLWCETSHDFLTFY